MKTDELKEILENHKKWSTNYSEGARAYLRGADLSNANLRDADLNDADLSNANLSDADLNGADLSNANLRDADLNGADLSNANLSDANLRDADLSNANLDFSCLTFSCKTLSAKYDSRIITQILYHAAMPTQNNVCDIDEDIKILFNSELFKKVVNKFHRVDECGIFTGVKYETN